MSTLRFVRALGCLVVFLLTAATYRSDQNSQKDSPAPLPGAPYFDFKQERGLIKGSHSIVPAQPIVVGTARQLLLDKFIVDSSWNCFRTVHKPEKYSGNPVIKKATVPQPDREIFTPEFFATVLYDPLRHRYRAWGGTSRIADQVHLDLGAYSESEDGIHWNAPELSVVEWKGSKANNLFMGGSGYRTITFRGPAIFSAHLECGSGRRA